MRKLVRGKLLSCAIGPGLVAGVGFGCAMIKMPHSKRGL